MTLLLNLVHGILKVAVRQKVLMFCSSPGEGKFTELDYPSGPWRDHFFRIGAARADGTVFEWTPDDGISFVLPGVDVVKEQAGRTSSETQTLGVTSRVADFNTRRARAWLQLWLLVWPP